MSLLVALTGRRAPRRPGHARRCSARPKIEGRAGTRWTYTASGMTSNVAARLAAQADGGEVVISESTRSRLGPGPPAEDLGVRQLKNVDEPMRIYRLR